MCDLRCYRCDIYNVDKILFHPIIACFLGLEFTAGMGGASLKEKPCCCFFLKMHHCEARKY